MCVYIIIYIYICVYNVCVRIYLDISSEVLVSSGRGAGNNRDPTWLLEFRIFFSPAFLMLMGVCLLESHNSVALLVFFRRLVSITV
jgi:hypothetical protein